MDHHELEDLKARLHSVMEEYKENHEMRRAIDSGDDDIDVSAKYLKRREFILWTCLELMRNKIETHIAKEKE